MSSQPRNQSREPKAEEGGASTRDTLGPPQSLSDRDEDEGNSTLAMPGSQNSALRSEHSSVTGSPRSKHRTRALVRHVQNWQRGRDQPVSSADEILKFDENLFRGLTPPPWPSDLTPHKKRPRPVEEILEDDSPRSKDKLSVELDEMDGKNKKRKMDLPYHGRQTAGSSSQPVDKEGAGGRSGE
ncbi:Transcription factor mst12 [Pestalotiopsis sp. IQ-011]